MNVAPLIAPSLTTERLLLRMLTVDDAAGQEALGGPAALAWCGHGPFSVSVTSVAGSLESAEEEVRAVVRAQLRLLPP